ncbi:hypothetical protein GCM10011409_31960 [Lentibacillus populi]|uniref:ABC transporter domain-containing protein n=1 Tax=Lentibacillus populi TaxID=1827502 RepID=A0A9W5TZN3_9BACI|nr:MULTISPECIES: ATP-binding cassette domain-containing protein [Bacillaceae]MBT2216511.1 ATP-binding cassette domain-containing protein [Virgibacillus dakarensis]GGB51969.1 hypothetical protein GCM10011409_31960 [Lentibacillus populi]
MIKVEGATQIYRLQTIFDEANFVIERGERIAVVGRNGAGKTTLLHALAGFTRLKKGTITIDGKRVYHPGAWNNKLSYLPEKFQLYAQLSVEENVQYFADTLRLPKEVVKQSLTHTNMWDHRTKRMTQLSKGMLQRVGLSIALIGEPEWIILDEPTSGLDPFGRKEFLRLLEQIDSERQTLLFTTHHFDEVKQLATHVLYLRDRTVSKMNSVDFLHQFEGSMSICGNG